MRRQPVSDKRQGAPGKLIPDATHKLLTQNQSRAGRQEIYAA
jgi:hypothetical protein